MSTEKEIIFSYMGVDTQLILEKIDHGYALREITPEGIIIIDIAADELEGLRLKRWLERIRGNS